MAGSPSIEQIVAQIRTALFGKDVRENIALGIEKCYEDTQQYVKKSTDIANDVTTTTAGKVLDARQGKVLDDKFLKTTYNYSTPPQSLTSCDDITTDSCYFISSSQGQTSIPDFPFNAPGWLVTRVNGNQKLQIAFPWDMHNPMKYRTCQHGTWSSKWYSFTADDNNTLPGMFLENYGGGVYLHDIKPTTPWVIGSNYGTVSWDETHGMYHVQYTNLPQGNYIYNILVKDFELFGLQAGKSYNVMVRRNDIGSGNASVYSEIYVNYNSSSVSWQFLSSVYNVPVKITIPSNAVGILVRLQFGSGSCNTRVAFECVPETEYTPSMAKYTFEHNNFFLSDPYNNTISSSSCDDVDRTSLHFNSSSGSIFTFSDFPFNAPGWLITYKAINNDLQYAINWNNGATKYRYSHFGTWEQWRTFSGSVDDYLPSCDLDTLTSGNHFYLLIDSNTYTHTPNNLTTGFLQVLQSANWGLQLFYSLRTGKSWVRTFSNNSMETNWIACGGNGDTYNITQEINRDTIQNTYNITTSPTITTDSNGWLQAVDDEDTVESNATDMTGAILSMLNSTGYCHLGPGVFYVQGGIDMPYGSTLEGCGEKTVVRLLSSVTSGYIVRIIRRNTIRGIKFSGGKTVPSDFFTDSTDYGSRHAIYCIGNADGQEASQPAVENSIINDCWFEFFVGSGFYAHNCGGGLQQGVMMSSCYFNSCKVGINLDHWFEYAKFTDCITYRCYWSCINNGGNNVFTSCTFHGVIGMLFDNSASDKPNNSHGSVVGCTFNHIDNINHPDTLGNGKAIHMINNHAGEIFTGCQLWYGNVYIEDSENVQFSDCLFGNDDIVISVTGAYPAFFFNNLFHNTPTLTINSNSVFKDNYLRNGTLIEP